jgi:hypothetical protein
LIDAGEQTFTGKMVTSHGLTETLGKVSFSIGSFQSRLIFGCAFLEPQNSFDATHAE